MDPVHPNPLEQLSISELRRRTSIKWRMYPGDVLPLWVAEMDVMLAEPIQRAIHRSVERGDTGYPAGTGYAEALQGFAQQRWGWDGVAPERTALVPDVMLGVVEVLRLVTRPGGSVVLNCPVYPPFYSFVEHMDRQVVEAPLGVDDRIDLDSLAEAFERASSGGRSVAYLMASPHNPTGTVHSRDELTGVARLAARYNVRVVADEIHAPLVLPGREFVPYLSVPGSESSISLLSASKGWNLAGLKAALAVAGAEAGPELARMPEEVGHGASHLGVIAHTAALSDSGAWLDALLAGLDANRRLLGDLLEEHLPGVGYRLPEGTYLAWLDCRRLALEDDHTDEGAHSTERGSVTTATGPAKFFLESARVALSAGGAFGTGGEGHVRLNYATSAAILTEAVTRMGSAVAMRHKSPGAAARPRPSSLRP